MARHGYLASVLIPTKNAGSRFDSVLRMAFSQKLRGGFEVIIVDSGSTDMTLRTAKKYPAKIHCIRPEEFNHGATRNLAASLADGKYLVFMTQDALPTGCDWLKKLMDNFSHPSIACVYGKQIAYADTNPVESFFYSSHYPDKRLTLTPVDADEKNKFFLDNVFVSNVNAAIKKDIWNRFKFKEDLLMSEDKEWALRVLKAGHKIVYDPKAAVYHSHNYSLSSLFRRLYDDGAAVTQICGRQPIDKSMATQGMNFFFKQTKHLWKRHPLWLPYSIVYNLTGLTGYSLGKRAVRTPRPL